MQDDQILWKAYLNGDEAAFAQFYTACYPVLYNYGSKLSQDLEQVKDCIQDLFLILRRDKDKLSHIHSPRHYLMVSLRHRLHKMGNVFSITDATPFEATLSHEHQLIADETVRGQSQKLKAAYTHLTPRQKEVVYLRFYENLPYEEIADLLHLRDVKSARNILYKALTVLRQTIPGGTGQFYLLFL